MRRPAAPRRVFAAVGAGALAAVGAALVTQYAFGMRPCPWCVLERLIFVAIALVCAIGWAWPERAGRVAAAAGALLLALSGAAAALWQHFQAAASASCGASFADKVVGQWLGLDSLLPEVFAPRASCADAAVNLLGVPYDFWALAIFAAAGLGAAIGLRHAARDSRPAFSRPA